VPFAPSKLLLSLESLGSNPTLSARPFAFNKLSAIHTVVHTVKPIPGAVCDAICPFLYFRSEVAQR